jgi:hypothetical protein
MGKSRPKKSGTPKKKRVDKHHHRAVTPGGPADAPIDVEAVDGMMSGMVGGFKRAVGAKRPAEKTWIDGALLWLVFAIVLAVVAWRFWG